MNDHDADVEEWREVVFFVLSACACLSQRLAYLLYYLRNGFSFLFYGVWATGGAMFDDDSNSTNGL
jgi:hypothetical protein